MTLAHDSCAARPDCMRAAAPPGRYGSDFGEDDTALLRRLQGFVPADGALHRKLSEILDSPPGELKVSYREYDWGLNEVAAD